MVIARYDTDAGLGVWRAIHGAEKQQDMPKLTGHYAHWPKGVPRTLPAPEHTLYSHLAAVAESARAILLRTTEALL